MRARYAFVKDFPDASFGKTNEFRLAFNVSFACSISAEKRKKKNDTRAKVYIFFLLVFTYVFLRTFFISA